MNVSIADIVGQTPYWVFFLFAYLMWRASKALQPRVVPVTKMWITPCIFIVWGLVGLFDSSTSVTGIVYRWIFGAVVGVALGLAWISNLQMDRRQQLVLLLGSPVPLLRVLIVFGAHYVLQVGAVMHPDLHDRFIAWDGYVSGASAGYFFGWGVRFIQACNCAPDAELDRSVRVARRGS